MHLVAVNMFRLTQWTLDFEKVGEKKHLKQCWQCMENGRY